MPNILTEKRKIIKLIKIYSHYFKNGGGLYQSLYGKIRYLLKKEDKKFILSRKFKGGLKRKDRKFLDKKHASYLT